MSALPTSLPRAVTALLAAGVLATSLAACGADEPARAAAPSPAPSPVVTTPPPKPKPAAPVTDPLTGRAKAPTGSVVALKIDNSPLARPFHRGFGAASIVYQELMEGGSSRFLAVFAPAADVEVGPIRSVREGDLELLQQYGRVALGGSGGNTGVLATFAQAAKQGRVIDVNFEVVPGPYRRAEKRRDAYNFYTSPAKVDRARPGGAKVKDIGLRFGPLPPGAGFPAGKASIRFSLITRVTAQYEPKTGTYAVFQDGDRMAGFAPANVVVQHAKIRGSRYVDVVGNVTPFTETIGKGPVAILRDGRRLSGDWRRQTADFGTRFLDDKGRDLPLKPGPTLVLLVPAGQPLTVS